MKIDGEWTIFSCSSCLTGGVVVSSCCWDCNVVIPLSLLHLLVSTISVFYLSTKPCFSPFCNYYG
ncbi:MAG: hypothetical protein LBQ50_07895 [Planctomycetaceae bacterium]|nr:hypothetical protein [Planctomycetaceae bacterium]